MAHTFYFTETLTSDVVESFDQFCWLLPKGSRARLIIESEEGTPTRLLEEVIQVMDKARKQGICFDTHGILFVSGYLRLFLLGEQRTITEDSIGMIHLPMPIDRHKRLNRNEQAQLQEMRAEVARFIAKRTGLEVGNILVLDKKRMHASEMIDWGIAHKIIPDVQALVS